MKDGAARNDLLDASRRRPRRSAFRSPTSSRARSDALRRTRAGAGGRVPRGGRRAAARGTHDRRRSARRGARMTHRAARAASAPASPPGQGARRLRRRRRSAAARRDRSGQRVRRRDGRADSATRAPCSRRSRPGGCGSSSRDVAHHMLSANADEIIDEVPALAEHRECSPAARCSAGARRFFPIECVIRGYLSGSAWKEYRTSGHARRRTAAAGTARERATRSAALQPGDQGRDRDTTRTSRSRAWRRSSEPTWRRSSSGLSRLVYERGRAIAAEPRNHHRRYEVRVRPRSRRRRSH